VSVKSHIANGDKPVADKRMGIVHQLILRQGAEAARHQAETKQQRQAVDAAACVLAEEESRLGITHAGFAMTSLPHKRIENEVWRREGGRVTLLVETGRDHTGKPIGIPYGSMARLILLYLQTEAIRTNSREVKLGRSMKSWMSRMGLTTGGKTYQIVTEQAKRISSCRLTFFSHSNNGIERRQNGAFVSDAISMNGILNDDQPTLWQDTVRLDEGFWKSLQEHPVPIREEALRAIGTRSLAIDVYVWLAYRLHSLSQSTPVSWTAIHGQFGAGFRQIRQIKPTFNDALSLALAVYPEARVDTTNDGILLHPSAPAVPKIIAKKLGLY
jgi:hypothetical protein